MAPRYSGRGDQARAAAEVVVYDMQYPDIDITSMAMFLTLIGKLGLKNSGEFRYKYLFRPPAANMAPL